MCFSIILPSRLSFSGQGCLELTRHQNTGVLKIRGKSLNPEMKKRTCAHDHKSADETQKVQTEGLLLHWNISYSKDLF